MKAFIAALSIIITETIKQTCKDSNIEAIVMKSHDNLFAELKQASPDIIFIQASIIEDAKENLITVIKEDERLGKAYLIINAVRPEGAEFAYQSGADAFLPIPFPKPQLEAILRNAFNLPKKILLAGSSASPGSLLQQGLIQNGFTTITAPDAASCINATKKEYPDLIIIDLEFPDMSGNELCRTLKSSKLLFHIPVVIQSPLNDATTIEKCFDAGAQDILLEPYQAKDNIKKISGIVNPIRRKKEKALVVDDSIMIRNMISKMFLQLGYIVITAENGEIGLQSAIKEKPDIITSDYDMPVMDGWGMCSELKKNPATKDIPIIMITSRNTDTDLKKAQLLTIEAYLTKPFTLQELQSTVKKTIEENRRLKEQKALTKYISADTLTSIQEVVEQGKSLEPEEKFITILFSDICSFSTICENYTAKQVVHLLNEYFEVMVDVLLSHNAIIDKFIGDAIVARFDSNNQEQDALNAVKSAVNMIKALDVLNQHLEQPIAFRVGISSGEIILGNIGCSKHRLDYTMIGDKVNIAERLQHHAPQKGCLISETTYKLTEQHVIVRNQQELSVKGKKEVVRAYEVINYF